MEDLGSGVRNMFHYVPLYVKDKNTLPIIEEGDVFKLTIPYEKESAYSAKNTENDGSLISNEDKILFLIRENSKITAYKLMEELSLSERGVRKILARLVELKIIERIGSRKDGEWVILDGEI
jgi:ATP-dependent DNA helicase RecG